MGKSRAQPVARGARRLGCQGADRERRAHAPARQQPGAAHPYLERLCPGGTVVGHWSVVLQPRCQEELQTGARRGWRSRLHHPPLGACWRRLPLDALPPRAALLGARPDRVARQDLWQLSHEHTQRETRRAVQLHGAVEHTQGAVAQHLGRHRHRWNPRPWH